MIKKFIKTLWQKWSNLVEEHNKLINPKEFIEVWHKIDIFLPLIFGPCATFLINKIHFQNYMKNVFLCIIIIVLTYLIGYIIWNCESIYNSEKNKKDIEYIIKNMCENMFDKNGYTNFIICISTKHNILPKKWKYKNTILSYNYILNSKTIEDDQVFILPKDDKPIKIVYKDK